MPEPEGGDTAWELAAASRAAVFGQNDCGQRKIVGRICSIVLTEDQISALLQPYGASLEHQQVAQVRTYLEILQKWNKAINLTAIRDARDCVAKHFGESLFVGSLVELNGSLLDIGSGAGFPGLALKIAYPRIKVCLLEPSVKKYAFLKEVVRACELDGVEVRKQRLEEYARAAGFLGSNFVTSRAVNLTEKILSNALSCLDPNGFLCLWTTGKLVGRIEGFLGLISWLKIAKIPNTRDRLILIGRKASVGVF